MFRFWIFSRKPRFSFPCLNLRSGNTFFGFSLFLSCLLVYYDYYYYYYYYYLLLLLLLSLSLFIFCVCENAWEYFPPLNNLLRIVFPLFSFYTSSLHSPALVPAAPPPLHHVTGGPFHNELLGRTKALNLWSFQNCYWQNTAERW